MGGSNHSVMSSRFLSSLAFEATGFVEKNRMDSALSLHGIGNRQAIIELGNEHRGFAEVAFPNRPIRPSATR